MLILRVKLITFMHNSLIINTCFIKIKWSNEADAWDQLFQYFVFLRVILNFHNESYPFKKLYFQIKSL